MSRFRKVLYALLVFALVFGLAEGALRLGGFRYLRVTTDMEFNYPRPGFIKAFFEIDPDLLYRIRPTVKQRYVSLTWQPLFELKIRDARTFGPKTAGTTRILTLGDSSTYGVNTPRPWPLRLQETLDRDAGPGRFEVLNLGVPGYTAFQGRRLLETRGERLDPDVVIIYFGWNDHLLALGREDAAQQVGSSGVVSVRNTLVRSRVYQGMSWLAAALRSGGTRTPLLMDEAGEPLRRVGTTAFQQELRRMIELTRSLGATPVLCTYPTAFQVLADMNIEPPPWLTDTHVGPGASLADALEVQARYNDLVRATGSDLQVPVVDLAAVFAGGDLRRLFDAPDGDLIHPDDEGYDLATAQIYQALRGLAKP